MHLRRELMPPTLDVALVTRLSDLAAGLDGAAPGQREDDLAEFNRLAGTEISFEEFQGIYGRRTTRITSAASCTGSISDPTRP